MGNESEKSQPPARLFMLSSRKLFLAFIEVIGLLAVTDPGPKIQKESLEPVLRLLPATC